MLSYVMSILFENQVVMSIISSRSAKLKEGFTPYHSEESDLREISLFSRLNINDKIDLQEVDPPQQIFYNQSHSDFLSVGSKKRKMSHELMKSSKMGGNRTFLNRSLVAKSSLHDELLIEMQSSDNPIKKELSENSCPVIITDPHDDLHSEHDFERIEDKPRFTKTKNLLRNISNYMHKFILYSNRAKLIIRKYLVNKKKNNRKLSTSKSISNNDPIIPEENRDSNEGSLRPQPQQPKPDEEIEVQGDEVQEQIGEFRKWVSELSIGNFNDYEHIWTQPHKYRALYRIICYKYYKNEAYCDIFRSRLTTKEISVTYLVQFIEGILHPAQFYRFK